MRETFPERAAAIGRGAGEGLGVHICTGPVAVTTPGGELRVGERGSAELAVSRDGDTTLILFGHRNWREPVEFMAHCSMKWAVFLLSLRQLVETGQGRPAPEDLKIDNWN